MTAPARAAEPKPLFQSTDTIKIRIEGPIRDLIRHAPNSMEPYDAALILEGGEPERHEIALSARGKSRRGLDLCRFPPLRVRFSEKPGDLSLFDGQKGLKLVTHCRSSSRYQQYYLLEYAIYRLLNVLTPLSHNVRMAEIDYFDTEKEQVVETRFGFFIEDTDDVAKRNGMKEIDVEDIDRAQLEPSAAARYALFQYMIGNLDWSMHDGPKGGDCCHNTKLIGSRTEPLANLTPVPYDFDYSGFVDAPYAAPPESVRVRSVKIRRYRGFCDHNEYAKAHAGEFRGHRGALYDVIDETPKLSDSNKRKAKKYLDGFFNNIEDDAAIERRLLSQCRD